MKLLSVDYPEQGVCQLTLTATAAELEADAQAVYERTRDTFSIAGFEKGAANRAEIEADRGEHAFWYDAINDIMDRDVPALYESIVAELGLDVVSDRTYDLVSVTKEEGFTATVNFCLMPTLTLGNYKGLTGKCLPNIVEEKEVERFIERKRQQAAELVPHKGPAVKGNIVHLTYLGFIDDAPFAGGKADNQTVPLGAGRMIPGFEEAILGHKAGDAFDICVTFPADYNNKEVAGKEAVFKAKLNDVCVRQIPALNADFAKKIGEVDTMDAYRAAVRAQLEGMKHQNAMARAKSEVLAQIADVTEGYIPAVLTAQAYTAEIQQIQQMLQMQRMNMAQFLQQTQQTKESFTESTRKSAENKVRVSMAMLKIAALEGLVPTQADVDAEIETRALRAKKTIAEFSETLDLQAMVQGMSRSRASEFVLAHATITE